MIRVGIGGWVFEPWRGMFFPKGLPQARELEHASRKLTSIEINGTFYRTQKPATLPQMGRRRRRTISCFRSRVRSSPPTAAYWRRPAPRSSASSPAACWSLKSKLGPVLWQMAPTKKFDPADFAAFLALLPPQLDGRAIRHAVEVRHESFIVPPSSSCCASIRWRPCWSIRQASDDCRRHQRFRLSAPAGNLREGEDRYTPRKRSIPGRSARRPGRRAARRPISRPSPADRRRKSRATCSST